MVNIVSPAPTPVFGNPDGTNSPPIAAGWTVQTAVSGSDQDLELKAPAAPSAERPGPAGSRQPASSSKQKSGA